MEDNWRLVGNKTGSTHPGFAVLLKHFELEGRFPERASDVPPVVVEYVAEQVKVDSSVFAKYAWSGRTIEYHRAQIRETFGFSACREADEDRLAAWLAQEVCGAEVSRDRLRDALVARCRTEHLEPPAAGQLGRVVGSGLRRFEDAFCERTTARLSETTASRLEALVPESAEPGVADGRQSLLAELKADPGQMGLETFLVEVDKLERVRVMELPEGIFGGVADKVVAVWRDRAAKLYPSDLRASPRSVRLTLLGALCWSRRAEITDGLVDLLIGLVHRIDARAERRVEGELLADLRRVRGKQGILFALAEAAVEHPDDTVRAALYPVVGETTLRDLVKEAKASDVAFRA